MLKFPLALGAKFWRPCRNINIMDYQLQHTRRHYNVAQPPAAPQSSVRHLRQQMLPWSQHKYSLRELHTGNKQSWCTALFEPELTQNWEQQAGYQNNHMLLLRAIDWLHGEQWIAGLIQHQHQENAEEAFL